jgi:hypothetical protein
MASDGRHLIALYSQYCAVLHILDHLYIYYILKHLFAALRICFEMSFYSSRYASARGMKWGVGFHIKVGLAKTLLPSTS